MNVYEVTKYAGADKINAAIHAASMNGGGRVYIPGHVEISSPIVVTFAPQPTPDEPPATIELFGDGMGATTITPAAHWPHSTPMLIIERSFTHVRDLQLVGRLGQDWKNAHGIKLPGGSDDLNALRRVSFERVAVRDTVRALDVGAVGISILSSFTDCLFAVTTEQVAKFRRATSLSFVRTSFTEFGIGCELFGARGCSFHDCHWEGNRGTKPSLMLNGCGRVTVRDAWFEESHRPADGTTPWFVWVEGCRDTQLHGTFVRKTPKARVLLTLSGSRGTLIDASVSVRGAWDLEPALWSSAAPDPEVVSGLLSDGDSVEDLTLKLL